MWGVTHVFCRIPLPAGCTPHPASNCCETFARFVPCAVLCGAQEAYGADSMILSLAMAQHSRLVNGGLEQADFSVGEALLKQQISLLGEVTGADSEDAAVARYKLATYYYANEMLTDAGSAVQQAAVALRAHYPEEHDLVSGAGL